MAKHRWICTWMNNASDWRDRESCGASSRTAFATLEAARTAAKRHRCQGNGAHIVIVAATPRRKRR